MPVVCFPRSCDSLAFYLGRDDFLTYRSKDVPALIEFLKQRPGTVLVFTHRHSMEAFAEAEGRQSVSIPVGTDRMATEFGDGLGVLYENLKAFARR